MDKDPNSVKRQLERNKYKELEYKVSQSNELVRNTQMKLTATQHKFVAYMISKIKPEDSELKEYSIKVADFCELTGIDKNWFYSEFIKIIDDFDNNKTFWIDDKDSLRKFRWFADTRYVKSSGEVKVIPAPTLREHLLQLESNFTEYELYNIMALKSKYAIKLFELFKSYQYLKHRYFEIEELKLLLDAENYVNFYNFRKRVLEPAINEINEYTELDVKYDIYYKGKKVVGIDFIIEKKDMKAEHLSYRKTIEKLKDKNKNNVQIKGQYGFDIDGTIYEES